MAFIGIVLVGVAITGIAVVYIYYRRDIQAAYQRLDDIVHQSSDTAHWKTEYAIRGDGYPVFLIHGSAGGFDQGMNLAARHVGTGFRVIALSRFGYPGTPLPEGATPKTQTDAYVCLMDELGIERAAVMTYSAGGPSPLQLALHYPERVSSLVLISTAISDGAPALPPKPVFRSIAGSDFIFWLLTGPLRSVAQRMFIPISYKLTPEEDAEAADAMRQVLPIQPRSRGLVLDMFVTNNDPHERNSDYRLEEIMVPVLVINATGDPLANFEDAQAISQRIPQARLVTIEGGGHLMLDSGDLVRTEIDRFLRKNAKRRTSWQLQ